MEFIKPELKGFLKGEKILWIIFLIFLPLDKQIFGIHVPVSLIKITAVFLVLLWMLALLKRQLRFSMYHLGILLGTFSLICFLFSFLSPVIPDPAINNIKFKLFNSVKILFAFVFIYLFYISLNQDKHKTD